MGWVWSFGFWVYCLLCLVLVSGLFLVGLWVGGFGFGVWLVDWLFGVWIWVLGLVGFGWVELVGWWLVVGGWLLVVGGWFEFFVGLGLVFLV